MSWAEALKDEIDKDYYKNLQDFVSKERQTKTIYPPEDKVMNAINTTELENVKCVIIGQDPYHEPNQAMGLSFSVAPGAKVPRSLQNIYKELNDEYKCYIPNNGDLTKWAEQGVLLLNTILTVEKNKAGSHAGKGWEEYTDAIIKAVENQNRPIVYMLWGRFAQSKKNLITNKQHLILEAAHPSPFSANKGFFGCGHFKKCNEFLMTCGIAPIDWQIEDI